jgi:hypothetical protein
MKPHLILLVCLILSNFILAQTHWESIVKNGDDYKYIRATANPATNWFTVTFSDASWMSAKSSIGFGYDDSTKVALCRAIYLRRKFTVADISVIKNLLFEIDYDDGFVAYLNGVEIARSANIIPVNPGYNAYLNPGRSAQTPLGKRPERFVVRNNNLVKGENLLAIQVINLSDTSSTLTSRAWLQAEVNTQSITYSTPPVWFIPPPVLTESQLPIVSINTGDKVLNADTKITATMCIVVNSVGLLNHVTDTCSGFNGYIGIKKRGESSLYFAKNNYGIETRDVTGNNLNVSLLNMPAENDWVLNGPYSDKTLVRNALSFHLAKVAKNWNSRTRFCELILNGKYEGVYLLMEKIKIDSSRVNIADLLPTDVSGDELTGGYILRVDKDDLSGQYFKTNVTYGGASAKKYQYFEPETSVLSSNQKTYIQQQMLAFENALISSSFSNPDQGYQKYIDAGSFVDYMLLNELAMDVDNFKYSTYLYKEKDSKSGKFFAGPIWDDDLGYGNAEFWLFGSTGSGWMYNYSKNDRLFWWIRLLEDNYYKNLTYTRWINLRASRWSNERLMSDIDSMVTSMGAAIDRNYTQWPVLGVHVWPNVFVGDTYVADLNYLKSWLSSRLNWMDNNLTGTILHPVADLTIADVNGKTLMLKLTQDYFNKKKLTKKHFKWADDVAGPEIDTIVYQNASQATIFLRTSIYNTALSEGLALKVDKDVLNIFFNITSNRLMINYIQLPEYGKNTEAYYNHGILNLHTQFPEALEQSVTIFNLLGRHIGTYPLQKMQTQEIQVQLPVGQYLLQMQFRQSPVTLKLTVH